MALLLEGKTLKDKLTFLWHYTKYPYFYFCNIKHPPLVRDVTLENEYGTFFCGNKRKDAWGLSSKCELFVKKHLRLDEGIFIDVGAYHGLHTIPLARRLKNTGKVVSIEPSKESREILEKNIKINNLKNVSVIKGACSSKCGERILHINKSNHALNSIAYGFGGEKRLIKTYTIDKIVELLDITRVDLVKIDAEGEELNVLKGAIMTISLFKPKLLIEIQKEYQNKVLEYISSFGYIYKQLNKEYFLFQKGK